MNHPTSKELVQELSRRSRGHGDGPVGPGVVFLIDQSDAVEEAVPLVQGTLLHRRGSARRRSRTLTARIAQSTSICISVAVAPPTRSTSLIRADRADQRDAAEVQPQVRAGQATVRGGVCRRRPGVAFPRTDDEIPVFGNASEVFDVIDQPGARWAKPGNPGDGAGPTRRLGQPARASHKTRRREPAGWLGRDEQFHPQSERSVS
jgi:hypothetical protein